MSTISEPPRTTFHPAMLINDTRYRGLTFQFVALVLIIVFMAFLGMNLVNNLALAGLNISFDFLGEPANYDINQALIPYSSRSTHLRAAIVGLLNTLLVAFMACITATIIGVFAGVLRLSKNWLVRKLMSVYVEAFRNVPVLIWILMIGTIVQQGPSPRVYLGEDPERGLFLGLFAFTNRGITAPAPVFGPGSLWVVLALVTGIVGAILWRRHVRKTLYASGRLLPNWPIFLILLLPPVIVFLLLGRPIGVDMPDVLANRFNIQGGIELQRPLIALWLALSVYTGAFIAENVRAGILSVSRGQTEAAASLGFRPNRIMNLVILPQALRVIIPPLISQYLNITKNSSLAIAVGYADITATLGGITLNQTGRAIESILLLMLFYLVVSLLISAVMNIYNSSVALKER
ncbi:L-glutamine ABC transporter membrane protein /L-glutamate ABC transporter membrane protein /L-aspartate ABC transporter membrane protein /L-asparagine ABC transporter membrane protein [Palleronia aestuarii]|uniref:L-glutamine ABC transporter membrane protein /L-glutamate ABC transporter membrane protein /L-aspartate ABC transporter membrane protein /L-asparagine ABC transporter membrane protein n=1 Tax=Palleronia aestuarii TaxID=568105 RepID=A0A2W7N5Z9_9RHOB|nr:ABC transporter permease subunit [Palleronia aestuarii]PZX12274.1 L-glutamine ABC transporter membrane protein /L-glutamate ABC transporter membrane protein /L-aspartate ABC transporter membrane protein /L-asparagine ABC transporter membrane protein [Palleronia aestuarii]